MQSKRDTSPLFNISNIIHSEIKDEIKEKLCFRENVLVSKLINDDEGDVPTPVGGLCLDVHRALDNKYIVYVSSTLDVDGRTGGSKISTWLDADFHTVEEKRIEYISDPEGAKQELYYGIKGDKYHVTTHTNFAQILGSNSTEFPLSAMCHLVGEGANFVLMRLLAMYHYLGKFEMSTLYINGDLCRNLYECTGTETGLVNDKKIMFCRIKRLIIEECGIVHECITVLTSNGNIIKQEWKDCMYILQMNPLRDPELVSACGCDMRFPNPQWRDDIELLSAYLDRHKLCEHKIKHYINQEPYLEDILADYMRALMHRKPTHVLEFTTEFFERYASITKK